MSLMIHTRELRQLSFCAKGERDELGPGRSACRSSDASERSRSGVRGGTRRVEAQGVDERQWGVLTSEEGEGASVRERHRGRAG